MLLRPEDPGGEDAVEERLHKRGAEEMLTFFPLESKAKGFFERFADSGQSRKLLGANSVEGFSGVGGEKGCEIFRRGQRSGMKHRAAGEFGESSFVGGSRLFRMGCGVPEFPF